jgi:AcrR family transcriptional regulator
MSDASQGNAGSDAHAGGDAHAGADASDEVQASEPVRPNDDDRGGLAIPPSIELAWGLRDRGTRGPKPGLTLDRIVAAGIKVALRDGIGALSMARVAGELGVGTMSLYRYVAAKDELLTLMVDTALGAPPPPQDPGEDWRAGLTRWAIGLRDAYRRHPWSLRVPITAPPLGPNKIAWLDDALRPLSKTPLSEQEKLSTVLLISGFVRNDATLTADFAVGAGGETVMPGYGVVLSRLIDPADFPALDRAIVSGALDDEDDINAEFTFGLQRILDGTQALIRRRATIRP